MKNWLSISVLILLSSVSASGKILLCQLTELTSGRVVAEKQAALLPGHAKSVLLVLSSGELRGTVRDTATVAPDERKFVSLRCFVRDTQAESGIQVNSTTSYENGRGMANGFCDGSMGSYCIDQVKARAKEAATRDARWTCEMRHGRADTMFPSCYDNCSPFSIPPGAPSQMVSCSANCSVRCEIP